MLPYGDALVEVELRLEPGGIFIAASEWLT